MAADRRESLLELARKTKTLLTVNLAAIKEGKKITEEKK